jgi:hypothetical protein
MSATIDDPVTLARDLEAELNYLALGIERPRTYTYKPPGDEPPSTVVSDPRRVTIRDARAWAPTASLDREGFALIRHHSRVRDFWDEAEIRARFYPEVNAAIIDATGADRVFIFDHTLRRRIEGAEDRGEEGPRQPVPRVHVDHTARSGPQRVRDLLPDEAENLLRGRVQIINFWRPIKGPLRDFPLAVADARSVAFSDLVPSDLVYRHRVGETYQVRHNPAHRWFYLPDMTTEEALLIKCFDSASDGRARFAPHTAFRDPTAAADVPPRESIELRTLVFHAS